MEAKSDPEKILYIDSGGETPSDHASQGGDMNGSIQGGSVDRVLSPGESSQVADEQGSRGQLSDEKENKDDDDGKPEGDEFDEDTEDEMLKEYCRANFRFLREKATTAARKEKIKTQLLDLIFIRKPREYKLFVFTVLLFFFIVVVFIVVLHIHTLPVLDVFRLSDGLTLNVKTLDVQFENGRGETVLKASLWRNRPIGTLPNICTAEDAKETDLCLTWNNQQLLNIERSQLFDDVTCFDFAWTALSDQFSQKDCFQLDSAHWFGGGLVRDGVFSLTQMTLPRQAFLTGSFHDEESLGPVLERYWITSNGVAIIVHDESPLEISINEAIDGKTNETDGLFCLYSDPLHYLRRSDHRKVNAVLNYSICIGDSIRHVHQTTIQQFGAKNLSLVHTLPRRIFTEPVWSTWAFMKTNVTQYKLIKHAEMIQAKGYRHSLLMIDSGWEEHYGDLDFDGQRFADVSALSDQLHVLSFHFSLQMQFHVNIDSKLFQESIIEERLVQDVSGSAPGLIHWWHGPRDSTWHGGVAALINIASRNASHWMSQRLEGLTEDHGIDYVHVMGGEAAGLPLHAVVNQETTDPNHFTTQSCLFAASLQKDVTSVQSAYRCQGLSVLVRLTGSTSTWGGPTGLNNVIPSALSLGLIGYPLFIPDAIGGTWWDGNPPSSQLYIRWLEVVTFFPIVHFSIPPDFFDDVTVVRVTSEMMQLRDAVVIPEIRRVVNESLYRLTPVIRPMWWVDSTDDQLYGIGDQFLVGDNILVAPILVDHSHHRDIFLPRGFWEDNVKDVGRIHIGPKLLHRYHVPLGKVAYFIRKDL